MLGLECIDEGQICFDSQEYSGGGGLFLQPLLRVLEQQGGLDSFRTAGAAWIFTDISSLFASLIIMGRILLQNDWKKVDNEPKIGIRIMETSIEQEKTGGA